MHSTSTITLDMCIVELQRQQAYFKKYYPDLVKKQKITPQQRDQRQNVNEKLLELLKQAKQNKGTTQPNFLQLLQQQP